MTDLAVIVPTRGRPEKFADLLVAIHRMSELDVEVWAALDDDDPTSYSVAGAAVPPDFMVRAERGRRRSLCAWTNELATQALESPNPPRFLASLGDDHRPRTPGWDRRLVEAIEGLGGSGIAYGNDLLQGENLPTAWVVSADIVRAVGWMMLPTCSHMYVDTATLALGKALDRIVYRPDVIVEHVHPMAGKTGWDQSYRESNTDERYRADREAYELWLRTGLAGDVERINTAIGAGVR